MFGRRIRFGLAFGVPLFLCAGSAAEKKKPPLHPINLNTASSTQTQEVPGIGPVTADKILKMRRSYVPHKGVGDLRAVKGIGPKRLEKMRKYLTVEKPVPKKGPPANSPPSKEKTPPETSPQ